VRFIRPSIYNPACFLKLRTIGFTVWNTPALRMFCLRANEQCMSVHSDDTLINNNSVLVVFLLTCDPLLFHDAGLYLIFMCISWACVYGSLAFARILFADVGSNFESVYRAPNRESWVVHSCVSIILAVLWSCCVMVAVWARWNLVTSISNYFRKLMFYAQFLNIQGSKRN